MQVLSLVVVRGLTPFKVFAYRSKLYSSVLVPGLIRHDIPPCDPDPPEKSWFSGFVCTSPVVLAQRFLGDCGPEKPWLRFTAYIQFFPHQLGADIPQW